MAITLEQMTKDMLGQLHWAILQMRAKIEQQEERIKELEAAQPKP